MKRSCPLLVLVSISVFFAADLSAQKVDIYSRPKRYERTRQYDAIHYRIKLRFDEGQKAFWGENTVTISPLSDDFTTCRLDAETFTVTSIRDEAGGSLDYEHSEGKLIVDLSKP
ncbi:MAG: aminopeptidase, partial [bacterium]